MKTKLTAIIASIALIASFTLTASAQFPINIPKLPKIKKEKPETPAATPAPTPAPTSAERVEKSAPPADRQAGVASPEPVEDDCTRGATGAIRENIETTLKQAEEFKPGLRDYYVEDFNDNQNEYLWAAISPKKRQEWLGEIDAVERRCFVPLLDKIAAAAKRTLPTYHPTDYAAAATPAEQKLLRAEIEDIAKATVFKVALKGPWTILKNDYGIPNVRRRYGIVWLKWPDSDDGFCRFYYVNLVQDYSGGGTYGPSHGRYAGVEPAGCPAGK